MNRLSAISLIVMTTSVVCVKVNQIRPQGYNNLEEWMLHSNNVYIGRRGVVLLPDLSGKKSRYPPTDSIWANPFKIGPGQDRADVISQYENYIRERLKNDPNLVRLLLELKGKTLGCWCAPEPCHGDVLAQLIDEYMIISHEKCDKDTRESTNDVSL